MSFFLLAMRKVHLHSNWSCFGRVKTWFLNDQRKFIEHVLVVNSILIKSQKRPIWYQIINYQGVLDIWVISHSARKNSGVFFLVYLVRKLALCNLRRFSENRHFNDLLFYEIRIGTISFYAIFLPNPPRKYFSIDLAALDSSRLVPSKIFFIFMPYLRHF